MDNSEQLQKINEKLQAALEKQVETIESSTNDLISGLNSNNSKFVDELDTIKSNIINSVLKATSGGNLNLEIDKQISLSSFMGDMKEQGKLNMILAFNFLKVKRNILKAVEKATAGGNVKLKLNKEISLSEVLGEPPKVNAVHFLRFLRIKKNILSKVEKATEAVELEIDKKMSLSDVLGSTPDQDILTKTRFFMIRQGLLNRISKAAKDFDPQESVDSITGGLGGGRQASTGGVSAATSSVIPNDAIDAITDSSQSLKTLVERSEGDVLQARENRKEDIARDNKRTKALSALAGKKGQGAGEDSGGGGGLLGAIGKGGAAIGKGVQGLLTGLGKGLKALADKKYLISAAVLVAVGGALFVAGKSLKEFAGLDFKSILIGVTALGVAAAGAKLIGKASKEIFIGSLAIAALGASLIPAAFAFGMFSDVNWAGVGIGIGVLVALGAAAFGLSFIAPAIFIGAAAIAALGAAMIPAAAAFALFGKALELMTPFISAFGDAISTVIGAVGGFLTGFIDSLVQLGSAGPGLIIAGTGIAAISAALIAFGASSALGGLLSFFGGNPVEKFIELGKVAPDLATAAESIDKLGESINKFDDVDGGGNVEDFVDQIKKLSKLKLKTAEKVMEHISDISGKATVAPSIVPSDSPVTQSVIPSLEQQNTPSNAEIKDDGPVTKEYIEAALASEKASKELKDFVADDSKKFKMVKVEDDFSEYEKKVFDNPEDQLRFNELMKAKDDAAFRVQEERRNIVGDDYGDDIQFAMDNNLQEGVGFAGDRIDAFFRSKVDAARAKMLAKVQGGSVEELEKISGNQLDMASRQNDIAKTTMAMGADGNVQVVNNKQGDTNQVNNTTINSDSHIDRTSDYLAPAF